MCCGITIVDMPVRELVARRRFSTRSVTGGGAEAMLGAFVCAVCFALVLRCAWAARSGKRSVQGLKLCISELCCSLVGAEAL